MTPDNERKELPAMRPNGSLSNLSDLEQKNENIAAGNPLCPRCGGTGNELYYMYRKCNKCNGTGVATFQEREVKNG